MYKKKFKGIFKKWPYNYLKQFGYPGPEPSFPWGSLKEIQRKGKFVVDAEWLNEYGDVVGFYLGRQPALLIGDPEMLEQIMVKQFHNFTNHYQVVPLDRIAKKMILNAKNEEWKYLRTLLSSNFSAKKLKEFRKDLLQLMIDQQNDFTEEQPEKNAKNGDMKNDDAKNGDTVNGDATTDDVPIPTKLVKRKLTDEEIIAQSIIFFMAGYETTATTLSFMAHLLALHQDIQDKVYQEIQSVIGKKTLDYDGVQKLAYLSQCVSETLRLYPIANSILRKSKKQITIKNWTIPAKIGINIPVYALHHNPKYWPDPEKFDPDRFSEEAQKTHTKFAYLPFGAGPRICIGMRLGLMEIKFAMAEILTKYKFVPTEKTENPIILNNQSLLSAKNGIWLKLEIR
ncbi:cytochrome P450 3A14 [Octopus vulgaris]|uniref:Cytochrome P450 3A14 n=1 Tax=Octopus vulgaris TaxID=6645 RepID=A0AA36FJA8_OCTVU|nr:cytochrome P450 3A14 [Octopus vulgaris]